MKRSIATSVIAAALAGHASAQTMEQPIFRVDTEGPRGSSILTEIDFGGGLTFEKFIFAESVTEFDHSGNPLDTRIVRGPDIVGGADPLSAGGADGNDSSVSEYDKQVFAERLTKVFQSTDLNNFIDNSGSAPFFTFVLELEKPLIDNAEGPDSVGEIIFFERGSSVANSFLLIEALDSDGTVLGEPFLISPDLPISISPRVETGVFRSNLTYANRSQEVGGISIDLDELGVQSLQRLRVSRATVGQNGLTSSMLSGGRDINPDFKLCFVQTYSIYMPTWMLGD